MKNRLIILALGLSPPGTMGGNSKDARLGVDAELRLVAVHPTVFDNNCMAAAEAL